MTDSPIFKMLQRVKIFGDVSNTEYTISHINHVNGDVVLLDGSGHFRPSKTRFLSLVEDDVEVVDPISDQVEYSEIEFNEIFVGDLIELRQTLGERAVTIRDRVTKIHNNFALCGTHNLSITGKVTDITGRGLEEMKTTIFLIDRPKVLPTTVGSIISLPKQTGNDSYWYTSAILLPKDFSHTNDYWKILSGSGDVTTRTPFFFRNLDWTLIREGW